MQVPTTIIRLEFRDIVLLQTGGRLVYSGARTNLASYLRSVGFDQDLDTTEEGSMLADFALKVRTFGLCCDYYHVNPEPVLKGLGRESAAAPTHNRVRLRQKL